MYTYCFANLIKIVTLNTCVVYGDIEEFFYFWINLFLISFPMCGLFWFVFQMLLSNFPKDKVLTYLVMGLLHYIYLVKCTLC